jgi:hypothetical protein
VPVFTDQRSTPHETFGLGLGAGLGLGDAALGAYRLRKYPPWLEHTPLRPPERLNMLSPHCTTYPTPFQKLAMQLK